MTMLAAIGARLGRLRKPSPAALKGALIVLALAWALLLTAFSLLSRSYTQLVQDLERLERLELPAARAELLRAQSDCQAALRSGRP
jgi:hypothetical protein